MDEQELERQGRSGEDGGEPLAHTQANIAWTGGPPATVALYSRLRRPYGYDITGRKIWIGLAVVFVLLTAYLVATRQPTGHLRVYTVPDATCSIERSGACVGDKIPYADFAIEGNGVRETFNSGEFGMGEVDLPPGTYRISARQVANLSGAQSADAVIIQGQTTQVTITYTFR